MSKLQLSTFLKNEEIWDTNNSRTENLIVDYSDHYRWEHTPNFIFALHNICNHLKVKTLFLILFNELYIDREPFTKFFTSLAKHESCEPVFLPFLKELVIWYKKDQFPLWQNLMKFSNIRKITWILPDVNKFPRQTNGSMVDNILACMLSKVVTESYSLRMLEFVAHEGEPRSFNFKNFPCSWNGKHILDFLKRNEKNLQNCLKATVILLGLRRRREIKIDRDVFSIIINLVWETKVSKIWTS